MIKVVSFDLDGTLADENFDNIFWFREIPRLYAEQHKVSLKKALEAVKEKYKTSNPQEMVWYDIGFWFRLFNLKHDWKKILSDLTHLIKIYKDVNPTLTKLKRKYKLIIVTHSTKVLLDLKIKPNNLDKYFTKIYSTPSDFRSSKTKEIYEKILKDLNLKPEELIHIGDDKEFDFDVPKKLGIKCFLIDRKRKHKGKFVVRNLNQFYKRIS